MEDLSRRGKMLSVDKWSNWSGAQVCHPKGIFMPKSEDELKNFFQENKLKGIRIVGSGHSFSPVVPTDEVIISLDEMQGLIEVDKENHEVEVWAGTKLHRLSRILSENGYGLINMGDVDKQSIAGALCSGTHGTGVELGILSACIEALTIVTPQGEEIRFSQEDPEQLNLARVNLGLLGVVTRMRLKVMPEYKIYNKKRRNSLFDCLEHLEINYTENRHYEFFWFPHSDQVQECFSNITDKEIIEKSATSKKLNYFLENDIFNLMSHVARLMPGSSANISKLCALVVGEEERVNLSYKVFAHDRDVRFQEMELAIEAQYAKEAILAVDKYIKDNKIAVHFPIEVRFTAADDIALSGSYQKKTCYLAFHMFKGMPYEEYFKGIQNLLDQYQPRAHWGKMSFFEPEVYHKRYPKLKDFVALRRKLDPDGVMLNKWLGSIFQ